VENVQFNPEADEKLRFRHSASMVNVASRKPHVMSEANPSSIKCPTCGKLTSRVTGAAGPFCSARCQMVDLGKWLGEEYRISEPLRPDHFSSYADLSDRVNPDEPDEEG
jgi:uncharacterized protein